MCNDGVRHVDSDVAVGGTLASEILRTLATMQSSLSYNNQASAVSQANCCSAGLLGEMLQPSTTSTSQSHCILVEQIIRNAGAI